MRIETIEAIKRLFDEHRGDLRVLDLIERAVANGDREAASAPGEEEGQGGEEGHERARQDPPTGRGRQRHEWKSLFSSLL